MAGWPDGSASGGATLARLPAGAKGWPAARLRWYTGRMNRVLERGWLGVLALCLGVGSLACGPTGGSYCEDRRECMGGNNKDEKVCNEQFDYAQELADIQGCTDEFDKLFECFFDKAKCLTENTGQTCGNTDDCTGAGFGATCRSDECVVKDLGLQNAEDCEAEMLAYQHCNTLSNNPFGG